MKLYTSKINPSRVAALLVGAVFLLAVLAALAGCTTAPDIVTGKGPSPSGNDMNSGVVSIPAVNQKTGHAVAGPIQIDAPTLAAYNSLIDSYASQFHPALKHGDGVTLKPDGTIWLDRQHFDNYGLMTRWDGSRITF